MLKLCETVAKVLLKHLRATFYKDDYVLHRTFLKLIHFTLLRYRLSAGTSEKIQLSSLIAAFQCIRDSVVAQAT